MSSIAFSTNNHKTNLLFYSSISQTSDIDLTGYNQSVNKTALLSQSSMGESIFFPFPASRHCSYSLAVIPSTSFKARMSGIIPFTLPSFNVTSLSYQVGEDSPLLRIYVIILYLPR